MYTWWSIFGKSFLKRINKTSIIMKSSNFKLIFLINQLAIFKEHILYYRDRSQYFQNITNILRNQYS